MTQKIEHFDTLGQPILPGKVVMSIRDSGGSKMLVTRLSEKRVGVNGYSPDLTPDWLIVIDPCLIAMGRQDIIDDLNRQYASSIVHDVVIKPKALAVRYTFELWTKVYGTITDDDIVRVLETHGTTENVIQDAAATAGGHLSGYQHSLSLSIHAAEAYADMKEKGTSAIKRIWIWPHHSFKTYAFSVKRLRQIDLDVPFDHGQTMSVAQFNNLLDDRTHPAIIPLGHVRS